MAPLTLETLPAEVIGNICPYLCSHCLGEPDISFHARKGWDLPSARDDFRALTRGLAGLSRTSKRLHAIANPVLYHSFYYFCEDDIKRSYLPYMRTLLKRADLAACVRQAHLEVFLDPGSEPVAHEGVPSVEELVAQLGVQLPDGWYPRVGMKNASDDWDVWDDVQEALDPEEDEIQGREANGLRWWYWAPSSFHHAFLVDLFLRLTTNLERVYLQNSQLIHFGRFLRRSFTLPKLKEVQLDYFRSDGGLGLDCAIELFEKAPNLERLGAVMCSYVPEELPLGGIGRNMRSVKLLQSSITLGSLDSLTSACPQLETFVFQYCQPGRTLTGATEFQQECSPSGIVHGLTPCRETLRHLEIQVGDWEFRRLLRDKNAISYSLRDFMALKTLIVDEVCIYVAQTNTDVEGGAHLVDVLPPSIGTVIVKGTGERLRQEMMCLAGETTKGLFPRLKLLGLGQPPDSPKRYTPLDMARLHGPEALLG